MVKAESGWRCGHSDLESRLSVLVRIPRVLRGHTAGKSELDIEADVLAVLLDRLYEQFPTLEKSLSSDGVDVLDHTNIFVNDVEVREIGGLTAKLKSGDTVTILPSMAGGCEA